MAMPMVGRAPAVDELRRAWARVRDHREPITAVVTGAAGTGKSALAAALVRADRDFDLLIMPGSNHGAAESPYGTRRRMDFFVRHLLGREPRWE